MIVFCTQFNHSLPINQFRDGFSSTSGFPAHTSPVCESFIRMLLCIMITVKYQFHMAGSRYCERYVITETYSMKNLCMMKVD